MTLNIQELTSSSVHLGVRPQFLGFCSSSDGDEMPSHVFDSVKPTADSKNSDGDDFIKTDGESLTTVDLGVVLKFSSEFCSSILMFSRVESFASIVIISSIISNKKCGLLFQN